MSNRNNFRLSLPKGLLTNKKDATNVTNANTYKTDKHEATKENSTKKLDYISYEDSKFKRI